MTDETTGADNAVMVDMKANGNDARLGDAAMTREADRLADERHDLANEEALTAGQPTTGPG